MQPSLIAIFMSVLSFAVSLLKDISKLGIWTLLLLLISQFRLLQMVVTALFFLLITTKVNLLQKQLILLLIKVTKIGDSLLLTTIQQIIHTRF